MSDIVTEYHTVVLFSAQQGDMLQKQLCNAAVLVPTEHSPLSPAFLMPHALADLFFMLLDPQFTH